MEELKRKIKIIKIINIALIILILFGLGLTLENYNITTNTIGAIITIFTIPVVIITFKMNKKNKERLIQIENQTIAINESKKDA